MSNERFWEETPADDEPETDHAPAGFSKESPVRPGKVSAIDPDTGEWKPIRELDTYEIGGHTIRMMEGPMAEAQVKDADGNHLGSVMVPFDPADGEPTDADLEAAMQVFHSLEYIRGIVKQDAIDAMVSDLFKHKADGNRPMTEIMVSSVSEIISEHVSIVIDADGPNDDDLTPEQVEALQVEANRIFSEKIPVIVDVMATTADPEDGGLNFWQQMARDIIAHALMYARDDATEEYGGPEAVEALDDDAAAKWEARADDLYKTGPYLSGAIMQGWRTWLPVLGELTKAGIDYAGEKPADDPDSIASQILKRARENLGLPAESDGTPPRDIVPVFDADGYGRRGNDLISRSAHKMFVSAWPGARTQAPAFEFATTQGTVTYAVDQQSLADAWALVDSLGDAHADIFDYILAKMFAGMAAGTRDIYGDFTITPQEIYDALGYQKHHKGGYKGEYIRDIVEKVEAMRRLQLQAAVKEVKNKNEVTYVHTVGLIAINETLTQVHTSGEKYVVAWNLRPGNWARELESVSKQYAVTMQGILKLHGRRDKNAKRIGRYLLSQYRILANKRRAPLVRKVRTILEQSGIELPTRNQTRFRDQITRALDTLADTEQMRGPVCFMSWKYTKPIDWSAADWYIRWLDSTIEIVIPDAIMQDRYGSLEYTGRKPRALSKRSSA